MNWRHSPEAMKCRSIWSEAFVDVFAILLKRNLCVLRWPYEGKGKIEFITSVSLSENVSKLFSEALLGICSSLVFQFGRSLVDVAAENHDTGRFLNSWHKNSYRTPIWWLYITHRRLWRHISHDVSSGFVVMWLTHMNSIWFLTVRIHWWVLGYSYMTMF